MQYCLQLTVVVSEDHNWCAYYPGHEVHESQTGIEDALICDELYDIYLKIDHKKLEKSPQDRLFKKSLLDPKSNIEDKAI